MQMDSGVAVGNVGSGGGGGGEVKRGIKRDASDSKLSDLERFEKRLRMLTIRNEQNNGNSSNLYTPVSHASAPPIPNGWSHVSQDESMQVDDTRDRVYIHDLDAELADVESDEEKLIFLPDIDKKLSKIPKQVLAGRDGDENENQELVLYEVPRSLTEGEGHLSVRKAMVESRRRAREKAAEIARQEDMNRKYDHSNGAGPTMETAHGYSTGYIQQPNFDLDAMDID